MATLEERDTTRGTIASPKSSQGPRSSRSLAARAPALHRTHPFRQTVGLALQGLTRRSQRSLQGDALGSAPSCEPLGCPSPHYTQYSSLVCWFATRTGLYTRNHPPRGMHSVCVPSRVLCRLNCFLFIASPAPASSSRFSMPRRLVPASLALPRAWAMPQDIVPDSRHGSAPYRRRAPHCPQMPLVPCGILSSLESPCGLLLNGPPFGTVPCIRIGPRFAS